MNRDNISISYIDEGKTFDWGRTSEDYASKNIKVRRQVPYSVYGMVTL